MDKDDIELLAELDLLGNLPRAPLPHPTYVRDLTEADLAAPRGKPPPKSLMQIRASHHSVARCLASGLRPAQVSLVTGYSTGRVAVLQNDPAFQALVADYREEVKSVFANMAERMTDVSLDALELLHERLNDRPNEFTIPMLLDVITKFADRTGYGPGQDVNIKMSMDLIDRPPRESFEDWESRRGRELESAKIIQLPPPKDKMN